MPGFNVKLNDPPSVRESISKMGRHVLTIQKNAAIFTEGFPNALDERQLEDGEISYVAIAL